MVANKLHFLLIPYIGPGPMIPMIDMAKLLAKQSNIMVTIATTPLNTIRYGATLTGPITAGLPVRFLELPFPTAEAGLPEGCESSDKITSVDLIPNFLDAVDMLQQKLEERYEMINPRPNCIISDKYMSWTGDFADKYQIPRIMFDGTSCFNELCHNNLYACKMFDGLPDSEPFVIPGLPDRVELTRNQLPPEFNPSSVDTSAFRQRARDAEVRAYGVVINSFEELEQEYVNEYKKLRGGKVWCIGPLSLCDSDDSVRTKRGNIASVNEQQCLKWLDSHEPKEKEVEEWLAKSGFEERIKHKGLIICGWVPQLMILSHPSIGGFLTHCGWNSTLESVSVGVPMITWPQFAEQFINEKLIVQILGVGVGVGANYVVHVVEEDRFGVKVESESVKKAIERVMGSTIEGDERRKRAKELGIISNNAIKVGGSSHLNLTLLIQDIMHLANTST
ncbi:hypothetical protein R6Q59_011458 [Mikania micrantha]|uniref:Glycosyltransferase n=1 Tax=Mikania micrantha TaxID=192012 RepID=A0A5N6N3Y7_9ASTR|nr:hypothetical protein E3N88_24588 [Mikania micrantha]